MGLPWFDKQKEIREDILKRLATVCKKYGEEVEYEVTYARSSAVLFRGMTYYFPLGLRY